jgi:quinol-cytochrome oxidoreductase complex cytochrome b subunit
MAKKSKEPATAMDYPEHERTYEGFLWLTKWSIVAIMTLLIAMAAGFFGGFGLVGGGLVWVVLLVIAFFLI